MARSGEPVMLPERRVAAGDGMIHVSVALPRGWTLDSAVPFHIAYRSGNMEIVRLIPKVSEQTFDRPAFPVSIPATFAVGRTSVEIAIQLTCRTKGGKGGQSGEMTVLVPVEVVREEQERDVAALIVIDAFPA